MFIHILIFLSTALADTSSYLPQQIHLSWSNDEFSMVVTWASDSLTSYPEVRYSPIDTPQDTVTDYRHSAKGNWKSFRNLPGDSDSRLLHVCSATMHNLLPYHYYTYIVGDPKFGWSSPYTFLSKKDAEQLDASFLVIADLGTGEEAADTLASLAKEAELYKYDGLFHAGDMAYNMNSDDGKNGDLFFRSLEPIAAKIPYFVSHGNHESWMRRAQDHFTYRLNLPGNSNNLYYSFNRGAAHFIFWTSELLTHGYNELQDEMIEFINNDLSQLDRTKYPWLISVEHRPFICSPEWRVAENMPERNKDCVKQSEQIRQNFEDLFYKYSVDLHIFGHVHTYERLGPSYNYKPVSSEYDGEHLHINPRAPVMIVVGNAGQQLNYTPKSSTPLSFSMSMSAELGYGKLIVYNGTSLRFEMRSSKDREIIDYVEIRKEGVYRATLEVEDSSLSKILGVLVLLIIL